jgi:hypothetical protein
VPTVFVPLEFHGVEVRRLNAAFDHKLRSALRSFTVTDITQNGTAISYRTA